MDLFDRLPPAGQPLAERMRPKTLDEVAGQRHLLGPGGPLRLAIDSGRLHSLIFWGPPGVGKTTLARLMATAFAADFMALSAVFAGVKEIREAMARARQNRACARQTVLFVDEVHRFNKAQQDAFLPDVEEGVVTFIGATTENPSFELNAALLSRAAVYVLEPLAPGELAELFERARTAHCPALVFEDDARDRIVGLADGDARKLLNLLEQLAAAVTRQGGDRVGPELVAAAVSRNLSRFDKGGDLFYDQISALHKSVRGSDPDAALYWLCRLLEGGADPLYLGRRLVRMAAEDIGLADPRALEIALNACASFERLGAPEGELALAQAAVFLACAAKSNALYEAYKAARAFVREDGQTRAVPLHLRNAPTRLMRELGHGRAYRHAHDEPHAYAAGVCYWPEGMKPASWYRPSGRGLEASIAERLAFLRRLDEAAIRGQADRPDARPRTQG